MNWPRIKKTLLSPLAATLAVIALGAISGGVYFLANDQLLPGFACMALPFILFYVSLIFVFPRLGFWSVFLANYFAIGIARYLPGPLGLSVDGLLVLTWLAVIFSQFKQKVNWGAARNKLTLLAIIWFAYGLFQLFNPEAVSRVAWFYAMRGVSMYMALTAPLVFLLFNHPKYLEQFLSLWAWFTLVGVSKGLMQKYIGTDPWENKWLAEIGGKTHLLPGGLRVFSFFTDAATYGGAMGFSGVVFSIVGLNTDVKKQKYFFLFTGFMAFWGMMISGTRGAMAVPFVGFALYALLSKRIKILMAGAIALTVIYSFLKFSTVGNSVYEIRRFRTALDPDNPSLMVRKENQKLLKVYLSSRPFGGGIGSAGNWGLRFSPGTFLAETPTDSWFVQIWAEQGKIGLCLHLFILAFIIVSGSYTTMFVLQDKKLAYTSAALLSGMFGVMAASYGSSAYGQMPNGIIIYSSMAFVFMMPHWEKRKLLL